MSKSAAARPTALYRFYSDNDELLYVGIAFNPTVRFRRHRKAEWWHLAVRHTVVRFPSRPEAEAAETKAIQTELPRYNIRDHPTNKSARRTRCVKMAPAAGKASIDASARMALYRKRGCRIPPGAITPEDRAELVRYRRENPLPRVRVSRQAVLAAEKEQP